MLVLETCGTSLTRFAKFPVDVLLHHQGTDGNAISRSPSSVLDIHANGNLRVFTRGKAHEDAVVLTMRVLSCSCLSADLIEGCVGNATSSSQHCLTHTGNHRLVIFAVNLRVVFLRVKRVERHSLHFLDDMRNDVIASVCYGCSKIGNLQRRQVNLSLPDADADDGQTAPIIAIGLVVIGRVGYHSAFLSRQVDAEFIAKPHADHIVLPGCHRVLDSLVLLPVAEHVIKSPAEITVT